VTGEEEEQQQQQQQQQQLRAFIKKPTWMKYLFIQHSSEFVPGTTAFSRR
jgi:hypothetical protein